MIRIIFELIRLAVPELDKTKKSIAQNNKQSLHHLLCPKTVYNEDVYKMSEWTYYTQIKLNKTDFDRSFINILKGTSLCNSLEK